MLMYAFPHLRLAPGIRWCSCILCLPLIRVGATRLLLVLLLRVCPVGVLLVIACRVALEAVVALVPLLISVPLLSALCSQAFACETKFSVKLALQLLYKTEQNLIPASETNPVAIW